MTKTQKKKLHPLMFVPGTIVWGCIIAGAVTKNTTFYGIAAVALVSGFLFFGIRALRKSSAASTDRKRIWENGHEAKARIVSIGTRGGGINDHPMVEFELDVSLNGRAPYRASLSAIVSKLAIPRIQPECEISVKVDPDDMNKLVLDAALTPYGYR